MIKEADEMRLLAVEINFMRTAGCTLLIINKIKTF
jgi:hypothetical protein